MKFSGTAVIFFFIFFSSKAQTVINGTVKDSNDILVERANVIVSDDLLNIIAYTYTNSLGNYVIKIENSDFSYLLITANSLGFHKKSDTLRFEPNRSEYTINFNLEEKIEELNEVLLKPDEKIKKEGTTTTFKVSAFKNDTEQTVEDILKNIPGVEVLKDGTIKAHGRFIDKLLIEGEDMFDKNYSVLSKNLDAKVLDAVQILEEFEDNPIFAKVLDSDKVAINLVLKDDYKNIWFGNVSGGIGSKDRIRASFNLGLIRKDIKFFNFNDYSNLGTKASQQLEDAPNSTSSNNSFREQVIETDIDPIYSIQNNENTIFNEGQSTFNDAFIDALSFVTSIKPNLKLRGTGYFTNDNQDQLFLSETVYNLGEAPIIYLENSKTNSKNAVAGGELELRYSNGEKSYLKNVLVYDNKPQTVRNNTIFNDSQINQYASQNEYFFANHLNYSHLIGKRNMLHTYLYFGQNEINQNATIDSPILNTALSFSENTSIQHSENDKSAIIGGRSTMIVTIGKFKNDLEMGFENLKEYRMNNFKSNDYVNEIDIDSLENNLRFKREKFHIKSSSKYEISKKAELSTSLSFDHVNLDSGISENAKWLLNPRIGLRFKNLKIGYFSFNFSRNYNEPRSLFFLKNYQLNGYQSFTKGQQEIEISRNNLYSFLYQLGNDMQTKLLSFRVRHIASDGKYSTENLIGQNLIFSNYNFVESGNQTFLNLDYTSYFKKLSLSTNFGTSQSISEIPIKANTSEFKNLKNYNSSYFLTGTTYFQFPLNFNVRVNLNFYESDFNKAQSKTNWQNLELNANYKLTDVWIASLKNNFYFTNDSDYFFIDLKVNYNPKKSRFAFEFILNNMINENLFSINDIDELSTYRSTIQLLPRYAYLWVKYRF